MGDFGRQVSFTEQHDVDVDNRIAKGWGQVRHLQEGVVWAALQFGRQTTAVQHGGDAVGPILQRIMGNAGATEGEVEDCTQKNNERGSRT